MNMTRLSVNLLIIEFVMKICTAKSHVDKIRSEKSSELLVQATSKLIETCYENETTEIGIIGNSPDSLIAALSNGKFSVSIVLMNNSTRMIDGEAVSQITRYKLRFFVIMASSSLELVKLIAEIENSRWWNHLAHFYILDWPINDDGCSRAYEILSTAWKMDLLEAKFMCIDGSTRQMIYSFNPYTSDAPEPWKLEKIHRGENDHPWTLLVREYRDNRNACVNMDFDKTNDLGGYGIRVTIMQKGLVRPDVNGTGINSIVGIFGGLARKIFTTLNATIAEMMVHNSNGIRKYAVDNEKADRQFMGDIIDRSDIAFIGCEIQRLANVTSTYRINKGGLFVMTQYRGYESQLSKFASVLDYSTRIGVFLVIIATVIFMKYILRQNFSNAILNTIRLISSIPLIKLPITVRSRIFLSSLFIFLITITGTYQSQWASMLSKRILLPYVDSMTDLARSSHTIYGHHRFKEYFQDKSFEGRYVGIDDFNCTGYVLRYPNSAACVDFFSHLIHDAARSKLHLSKSTIVDIYFAYPIRKNWPLEQRINSLFQRLIDANLYEYASSRARAKALRTMEINKNEDKEGSARVFTLNDLSFAFAILAIGLSCATLCFIMEIVMNRRKKCSRNVIIRAARH